LLLDLSHISYLKAKDFFKFFSETDINKLDLRQEEKDLFNGFEYYMASIIFAYTSLESFANEMILEDYKFESLRHDKKCAELYNKEQIERNISLKTKLGEIIPEITGIELPKDEILWNKFVEMEKIRDGIIHMKSSDRKGLNRNTKEISYKHIWNRLINNVNFENYSKLSLGIIILFYNKKKSRWLQMYPN